MPCVPDAATPDNVTVLVSVFWKTSKFVYVVPMRATSKVKSVVPPTRNVSLPSCALTAAPKTFAAASMAQTLSLVSTAHPGVINDDCRKKPSSVPL
jgi:hypothetical protein